MINSVHDSQEAIEVYKKVSLEVDRSLGSLSIDYLGFLPFDEKLLDAVKQRRPVLEIYPHAISSRSFMKMAKILIAKPLRNETDGGIQFFWRYLFRRHQLAGKNGGFN